MKNLMFRLNRFLPEDISVTAIKKSICPIPVPGSVRCQEPINIIFQGKRIHLAQDSSWFLYGNLDIDSMNRASAILLNHSDFTSFCRLHSDNKTNICKIYRAGWEESAEQTGFYNSGRQVPAEYGKGNCRDNG